MVAASAWSLQSSMRRKSATVALPVTISISAGSITNRAVISSAGLVPSAARSGVGEAMPASSAGACSLT